MEEAKGVVKHVALIKFKDEVSADETEKFTKGFANLVNLIEPFKSFHWGTNVSTDNLNQGFTHFFECTFESTDAIKEYEAHPAHVEFANLYMPTIENIIVFDYKPTIVSC